MTTLLPAAETASFDDPLAMLIACHGRIRKQLATLARLERHLPEHGHDADARAAARAIMRYFDTAAVHHHEDEEQSLMPRLIARAPEARGLEARLLREHADLAEGWRKLRPLLTGIAAGQRAALPPKLVADVTAAYESHIAFEESELIPLARQALGAGDVAAMGQEMALRRGLTAALP